MNNNNDPFDESHHRHGFGWLPVPPPPPKHRRKPDDHDALHAIALSEGWLIPPIEVTRIALRPWQQAVFWGLRVYIVVMLIIMAFGFVHVASG